MELKIIWSPEDIKPGLRVRIGGGEGRSTYLIYKRGDALGRPIYGLVEVRSGLTHYEGDLDQVASTLTQWTPVLPYGSPLEDFLP